MDLLQFTVLVTILAKIKVLLLKGSTSSSATGPSYAYGGAFYQYTEASSPRAQGDVFLLESRWLSDSNLSNLLHCH